MQGNLKSFTKPKSSPVTIVASSNEVSVALTSFTYTIIYIMHSIYTYIHTYIHSMITKGIDLSLSIVETLLLYQSVAYSKLSLTIHPYIVSIN